MVSDFWQHGFWFLTTWFLIFWQNGFWFPTTLSLIHKNMTLIYYCHGYAFFWNNFSPNLVVVKQKHFPRHDLWLHLLLPFCISWEIWTDLVDLLRPSQISYLKVRSGLGEAAYFGFDSVLHTPPPLPHTKKKPPHPLFIVSLWTPVILAEPAGWVDFQEKKAAAELVKRPLWSNPES